MKKARIILATAAFASAFAGVYASAIKVTPPAVLYKVGGTGLCKSNDTVDAACTKFVAGIRCSTNTFNELAYEFNSDIVCTQAIFRPTTPP